MQAGVVAMGNLTILPCTHCFTTAHERTNWGGLTGSDFYCVDDAACQSRRMEIERQRAAKENEQENLNDDRTK
jgi:predicted Fe-S protein YdhL (DUF1289 family)